MPWGTPDRIEHSGEETPSKTTRCVQLFKNEDIQFFIILFPLIPYHSNLYNKSLCGTVSNALVKSVNNKSVCILAS